MLSFFSSAAATEASPRFLLLLNLFLVLVTKPTEEEDREEETRVVVVIKFFCERDIFLREKCLCVVITYKRARFSFLSFFHLMIFLLFFVYVRSFTKNRHVRVVVFLSFFLSLSRFWVSLSSFTRRTLDTILNKSSLSLSLSLSLSRKKKK